MALFQFNGYDLNKYFKLIKVEHEIGNEHSISTDSAPSIGVNVQKVEIGAKKIKLTVSLATRDLADMTFIDPNEPAPIDRVQFYRVREEAARVLHTKKAVKLYLPTEPDRYYLALVKGEVSLKGISDWYDEATIEFIVPDGVAHSTTYKRVTDYQEKDGKMIFSIDNEGSTNAYPIITLKANAENGYYGLVSDKFAFEAGNTEEADGKIVSKSEVLYDFRGDRIPQAFAKGAKNVGITNVPEELHGILEIQNIWGRPHLALGNPDANIALRTTDFFVIDIDVSESEDGFQSLEDWELSKYIPKTLTAKTPSGGRHIFLKKPKGVNISQDIRVKPGIDIKANNNNYILVAPSNSSKGRYSWNKDTDTIAEAPKEIIDILKSEQKHEPLVFSTNYQRNEFSSKTAKLFEQIVFGLGDKGGRNNALASFIGGLLTRKVDIDAVYLLAKIANHYTPESLPQSELDRTFESIVRKELDTKHGNTTTHSTD